MRLTIDLLSMIERDFLDLIRLEKAEEPYSFFGTHHYLYYKNFKAFVYNLMSLAAKLPAPLYNETR